jgi:Mg-chelatase subunit ChlD
LQRQQAYISATKGRHAAFRGMRLNVAECKGWSDPPRKGLAGIYQMMSRAAGGNTPLGEAVEFCAQQLLARNEPRKVAIVFTDGQANGASPVKERCRWAERMGVEVVLVGIGHDQVRSYHSRSAVCRHINDLPTTTMQELAKALGFGSAVA